MSKIDRLRQRLGAVGLKKKKDTYTGLFDDPAIYRSIKLKGQKGDFSQKWLGKDNTIYTPFSSNQMSIPFDYEKARKTPVAPLQKEVPFGKENRTKKQIMQDVEDEKYERQSGPITEALGGTKNIGRSDRGLIYPKKPTQKERTRIIQAKQRLARIYES